METFSFHLASAIAAVTLASGLYHHRLHDMGLQSASKHSEWTHVRGDDKMSELGLHLGHIYI